MSDNALQHLNALADDMAGGTRIQVERIKGDSMSPDLNSFDAAIFSEEMTSPSPEGLFLIDTGDGMYIRRLQYIPGSVPPTVRLIPSNPAYTTEEVPLASVHIIGRIVGKVQRL